MLQRNISGESASIKVSIEIEEFQQPVTFTCDGMFLISELEFVCKTSVGGLRLYTQARPMALRFCNSQVSGAWIACGECGKGN